jgi:predicted kinase
MAKCYQLVGVPGSGKSTWVSNQDWAKGCAYVSTDGYVDRFAQRMGKTYSEVFDTVMSRAVRLMMQAVRRAQAAGKDVIWDQTSTTVPSRSRKFRALPEYEHIAVVFRTPDRNELDVRLSGRPGKHIPKRVIDSMIAGWNEPTEEEGFTEIWYAE